MRVVVGEGSCGIATGAKKTATEFEAQIASKNIDVEVDIAGCVGICYLEPIVDIYEDNGDLTRYVKVQPADVEAIVDSHLVNHKAYEPKTIAEDDAKFLSQQYRVALKNCGVINPEKIEAYQEVGGYEALTKVLTTMKPQDVVDEIKKSTLRGRGGGGFPAGTKWEQVLAQKESMKYVVCNGDEGDPGAFMDRSIMEGDPHKMLEGMMLAGYATGASEGYIYVRAEYPLAVKRLGIAIDQAREAGFLGKNILDTDFSFDIKIVKGAGAFVCGEGSALTTSIEGNRGMPRVKPPRTVEQGLFAKPTVLNNVETFANATEIIKNGADWYLGIGPANSPGTKAFALTGNISKTGLIEVPMGTTLREVIYDIGGGIKNGKAFKAVQIGGPSGGCLTKEHMDLPLDFDSLKKVGAMIGSGGLVVMDEDTCMVEVARFFMDFTQDESCGKCVPCREGTRRMLEIMEKIVCGNGEVEDLDVLEQLAETITATALCGLGKTAANPVVSTLKYFRDEYMEHIVEKRCQTGTCKALRRIYIDKDLCKGCSLCSKACPVDAIYGKIRESYEIDAANCIKCGSCIEKCNFGAIKEA